MKTVVVGGNSRNIGKTSLACSIISATREREWTAVKVTQFGHGICSSSGEPCGCAPKDPECPFEISVEAGDKSSSDTARMLAAGARESLWVSVAMGQLATAMPAICERIAEREHVLFESNSVVEFIEPDAYLGLLDFDVVDFKPSAARLLNRVDGFVLPRSTNTTPPWPRFDVQLLSADRTFRVEPPSYCDDRVVEFVERQIKRVRAKQ